MVNQSSFIARMSGRKADNYYIDHLGAYKVADIAKITGIKLTSVKDIYISNGAVYDDTQDVYYFGSLDSARKAIAELFGSIKPGLKGKIVYLSEAEVECIRRALINEGSNTIHLKSRIKDEIFKKLNE